MDAVDVLMEARAYIEKGWCQNALMLPKDANFVTAKQRCVLGAISTAALYEKDFGDLLVSARQLLARAVGQPPSAWQDEPGRTQEEVLEAFDRAIGLGLERAGER